MNTNKKLIFITTGIFLLALLIRCIHFFLIKDSALFLYPLLDAKHYDVWAVEILNKDWLSRDFDFMSPAYPYFLSIIYFIFGHSIPTVALIQFVIGSVNCSLIYVLAKKVFSIPVSETLLNVQKLALSEKSVNLIAIIAAIISVFYGISIFYEGLLLKVTLINFCNIMMLLMLFQGFEKKSFKFYFFAGLFLGLSAYLRPNILLFIPLLLLWYLLSTPFKFKNLISFTACLFLGYLLISVPFGIRNYSINNELVFTSGAGGINFYLGNNPEARGVYEAHYFNNPDTRFEHEGFVVEASRRAGYKLSTMEASHYWYGQSFDFIKSNNLKWIGLLTKKFFIFWNAYEVPINGLEYNMCKDFFPLLKAPLITFGIISPLALLGIILLFNKSKKINLLLFYTFAYLMGAIIYYISSEYRFPVVIPLFIFAAYAGYWIIDKINLKEIRPAVYAIIGLIPLVLFVNNKKFKIFDISNNGTLFNNIGTLFICANDYNNAIDQYKKAVIADPEGIEFRDNLAHAYYNSGMRDQAIEEYNKILEVIKPHYADTFKNTSNTSDASQSYPYYISKTRFKLGEIYLQMNQFSNAKEQFNAILINDSTAIFAMNDLGIVYANLGEFKLAEYWFEKALKIKPDFVMALKNAEQLKKQNAEKQK